jgi:hypothetical protein
MCSHYPKYRRTAQGVRSQATSSNPTTGFLTATTFIYALGAGITAAAGTRLALQWLLSSVNWIQSITISDTQNATELLFFVTASIR